ncbi:DUF1810 family protein [Rhizobium sp. 2YAF20]|uniref:DUF1810 family protein n=1 Tax=Rhizobium sp. 2YAF20 TaxID=3233027 RepID=UPI003F976F31
MNSLDEASAYFAVPVLGGRYRECIAARHHIPKLSAHIISSDVDAKKLHASMTILDVWFEILLDPDTMSDLARSY